MTENPGTAPQPTSSEHAAEQDRTSRATEATANQKRKLFDFESLSLSHAIQIGAALAFALAALKLIGASAGDPAVAGSLLRSQGLLTTILALAMVALPITLYLTAIMVLAYRGALAETGNKSHWLYQNGLVILAILFTTGLALLPWTTFASYAGIAILFWVFDKFMRKRARTSPTAVSLPAPAYLRVRMRDTFGAVVIPLAIVLSGQIVSNQLWIPREQLEVREAGEASSITGYVLELGDPWTTILIDDSRTIVIVKSEDIEQRTACPNRVTPTAFEALANKSAAAEKADCGEP